ncbi:MAG TPA: sensor histidine kinase [Thermoanaerobaculia bacterium]|nr:sensor histidine kinase [Thermoanaerobaculia bacterium]
MGVRDDSLHFDVHPSVVFQLGADLVSDECQALIELVKNSYDAQATYVHIDINTHEPVTCAFPETYFPDSVGYIRITDDGQGMSLEDIRQGWLIVSDSLKRKLKTKGLAGGGRTPLGDKGLGRLGSQRLAKNLEVMTVPKGSKEEYHVGLSWEKFWDFPALHDVPIEGPKIKLTKSKQGTTSLLSGLVDPDRWRGAGAKTELEERFAELVSPFEKIAAFELVITVDGTNLDMARIGKKVRDEAGVSFQFTFDGERLDIKGQLKLKLLEPGNEARQRAFQEYCERDNGQMLLAQLQTASKGRTFQLMPSQRRAWFASFNGDFLLDHIDGIAMLLEGVPANPGPFRGEVDGFDLSHDGENEALGSVKELRKRMRRLAGVRVYRDGFGVRVDTDFLKLGKAWTSGKSYYGLKPGSTIGFIAISARDNPLLVETTDREGFQKTPYLVNFEALLAKFVGFTHDMLEFFRRETIKFCDRFVEQDAEVPPNMTPSELAERIGEHLKASAALKEKVSELARAVTASGRDVEKAYETSSQWLFRNTEESRQTQSALDKVRKDITASEHALKEVAALIDQTPKIRDAHALLTAQIDRFNDRLAQAYETMSLGLTAEALVHEIATVADGLAQRVADIRKYFEKTSYSDDRIRAFVRHVDATVSALRKQLGHLDPSLRYVRERRVSIVLADFLFEVKQYHEARWRDAKLVIDLVGMRNDPGFEVQINRGKLTQIVDNLILNSEYWLREDIRRGRMPSGIVTIEVQRPYLLVSDNGTGIDLSVEGTLFEPFATAKSNGRGLGLFIVREFLQSEGCGIDLCRERNSFGRYFKFILDLSGIANG